MCNERTPILSIIIPSYNTSKYVDECLKTFIDEKLFGKITIYLIDDGATDDTAAKIKPFTEKYPQLFKFYHKENGGHGSVINYGVHKLVKTKYFKIIDGDDWINTKNLIDLVDYLYKTNDDLIISDFLFVYPAGQSLTTAKRYEKKHLSPKTSLNPSAINDFNVSIHSMTYKTSIFIENNIVLPEKLFYEDNLFVIYPSIYLKSISYTEGPVYCYRSGNPDQSVSCASFAKHYADAKAIRNYMQEFFEKNYGKVQEYISSFIAEVFASGASLYYPIAESFPATTETSKILRKIYEEDKKNAPLIKALRKYKYFRFLSFFGFNKFSLKFFKKYTAKTGN